MSYSIFPSELFWICHTKERLWNTAELTMPCHKITLLYHRATNAPAAAAKSLQSCPTLWDPREGSPPGSPIPGILQARTLEWVAISFSNALKWKVKVKSLSHVRPSVNGRLQPTRSSIHRIFQARVLEWVAITFSTVLC